MTRLTDCPLPICNDGIDRGPPMTDAERRVRAYIANHLHDSKDLAMVAREVLAAELPDLCRADAEIPPGLPDRYSQLIFEDHSVSSYLLQWPEGNPGTDIHDHGDSHAVVCILRGEVLETVYAEDGKTEERILKAGQIVSLPAPWIHKFEDAHGAHGEALSLHFYEPQLTRMGLYTYSNGRLARKGEWKE